MRNVLLAVLLAGAVGLTGWAQTAKAPAKTDPLVSGSKMTFTATKDYITRAAAQVPENLYGYRPTPEVRAFGQLFGHIANTNYQICAPVVGEKPPAQDIEKSKTAKADLVKALADSFGVCDKAWAGTTDANAAKSVDFFGSPMARLAALSSNDAHNYEHYGNIVTYMRLNKMVPPSSQPPSR